MQSNKVEELTDKLEGCLSLDTEKMDKHDRYVQEGKKAARCGELSRSLELFQLAYQLQPSDKLKKRVRAIQDLIQRDEENEEEFVDVNNSGLKLYKELYEKLYDHQKEGVGFLYSLYRDGRKGGILADDMGLGKTIQVISFLSGMYDAELAKHILLVIPALLIKNWVGEFSKWTPGMRVKEFHGTSKAERNRNLERIQRKGGVVITTYQMLINNYEQIASYDQREFRWDYVILDEAHTIKNSSTKTAKSAHAIPARHRVLLTGTPVQNNLREMWALFDFACQGSLLGTSKTFKTEYENPITRAREKDATPEEKALGLRISQNLMDIIKPYFLRRTKGDVQQKKQKREEGYRDEEDQENKCPNANEGAEMPSLTRKNDLIVWTYLSSVQEDIYNQFISLDHIKELLMTTRSPLAELTVLKKLCDHPGLLSNRAVTQLGLAQGSAFDSTHPNNESESAVSNIDYISDDTLIVESGKLQFLVSLMECLREEGHRTLIFSQSRKMLDIMERVLRNRNFCLLRLDGTVTQLAERKKRIKLFQTDKRYTIFLLTTQVGGVGITLTAANRVVIFDPSWNPATDAQAVDRAYRIGQTENVVVYRLITCGTVEEKIYRRQVLKDSLIRQTTGDKKNPFRYFSKQDLHELFKLEDTRSSSTQQQLQAMHSKNRCSDTKLDQHIARLHSMEMFGLSDHDLMFTKEVSADEDIPEDAESHHFIQTRVQKAQELMQAESELHGQLMDSMAQNTEPACLRKTGQPKSAVKDQQGRPRVKKEPTITVTDLTHYSFIEPELEEDEQNSPLVEEVAEVVGEEVENLVEEVQAEKESSRSSGQTNVHVLNTEVSPVAKKQAHHVITLDNSSDEAEKLCSNATSEHQYLQHSFPNPSHQFPKLEELSAVSDALDNREVQMEEPRSTVLSPPPSRDEDTAGKPFKAEVEILPGNFILQLENSGDLFLVEEEKVHEVEESEETPEFHPQMGISLESLKELITLDLTHYSFSEPELEEDEQNSPLVEEVVEVVGKEVQAENESSCSSGQRNVHVLNTEVSPVGKKQAHHVITLDDSSDEAEKLCGNATSEHQYLQHSFPNPSHQFPKLEELSAVSDALDNREVQMDGPHSTVLSPPPCRDEDTAGEPFKAEVEILLRNFFLQLEDSADMFSVEEVHEVEESEESPEFQLQMEISLEKLENAIFHDRRQEGKQNSDICNYNNADVSNCNGEVGKYEPLLNFCSAPDTPADDSFVHFITRKKTQVIYDTEEEEEEDESEKPCLTSSPLLDDGLKRLCSSMPKSTLTGAQLHRSLNTSVASRRSFLMSMLENESDEESEEPSEDKSKSYETSEASEICADESVEEDEPSNEDKIESYQMSQASETHTDESLVEEEEPNGETLNTEESESNKKLEEREENMESRGDQEWFSAVLEYLAELESSEMDQCAPKSFPLETHILPVSSTSSDVTPAKASENTYELLILSGKQSLAEGRKQEALDFFLKAIDINAGDSEIQLLIIQLYRQLSQKGHFNCMQPNES